ncbi:hypothetical protein ABZS71_32460 [Streptomyces sp. NPDC005393]|uniref:hypothetical protein n=1 Tax=Streptomyces sp. NPDC005393 TaxID=3157041 RepID=UPI0033BED7C0
MRSLPLTLAARLLPVALIVTVGVAMPATGGSDAPAEPTGASPPPSTAATATAGASAPPRYPKPPSKACATLPASTVKELVPGAKTAGNELKTSDVSRRTGCSWHALDGFDYRWLDISYDVTGAAAKQDENGSAISDLGDTATLSQQLTTNDDQEIREAVVTVHQDNAKITVTYNGGDFSSHQGASAGAIRKGALTAAEKAVAALDG